MIYLMTNHTSLFAQFTTAALADNAVGTNVMARYTSNDVLDISNDTYKVSVWDNPMYGTTYTGKPGIAYKIILGGTTSYTGTIDFPLTSYPDVQHPDVCIINNGSGRIFAIVAYNVYGSVNTFNWDVYEGSTSGTPAFTLFSANSMSIPGTGYFGNYVNIDGNENGDFAIISSDGILTGSSYGSTPTLNNSGSVVLYPNSQGDCDISLYYGISGGFPYNIIYISYIDIYGNLQVLKEAFSTVVSGNFPGVSVASYNAPNSSQLFNPRIATPNSQGLYTDFTVVFDEVYYVSNVAVNWYIRGFTSYNGTLSSLNTYNDAAFSPYNAPLSISDEPNLFPVVAYDSRSSYNIWVGWVLDEKLNAGIYTGNTAIYPIALKCNNDGSIPSSSTYWEVPKVINRNDEITYLSLSARFSKPTSNGDKLFATYANNVNADINYKDIIPSLASNFRIENSDKIISSEEEKLMKFLSSYASDTPLTINIFDPTGKLIFTEKRKVTDIFSLILDKIDKLVPSIYLLNISSNSENIIFSDKIFKHN